MKERKSVLLGLSGGVDSAIAAHLLKKQGFDVRGVFLKMFSTKKSKLFPNCNWLSDYNSAQKVAHHLNIPLVKIDFEKIYRSQVLKPMFEKYSLGLTPNPDISCNTIIKFPMLWKEAKKIGCEYIATGHYARIKKDKFGYHLFSGKDSGKDQSYFLSELTQKDLSHSIFPVGELTKVQVRELAKELNLPNHDRSSTKGLCFVGNIHFQSFLKGKLKNKKGIVKDNHENILGEHLGSHFYTIGQKALESQGIKIKKPNNLASKRYYIYEKKGNVIYVAPEKSAELFTKKIKIKKPKIINKKIKLINLKARIRHLGKLYPGKIKGNYFILKNNIEKPAPGQFLVLYKNQELIGSAEIR